MEANVVDAESIKNDELAVSSDAASETASTSAVESSKRKNRIQVSNTKKPQIFYLNLAKKLIMQNNDVELSAMGRAIPNAVAISEYLKDNGFAVEKYITTSTVISIVEGNKGCQFPKPKIEILLGKRENMEQVTVYETLDEVAEYE